jgi:hypothetical protein
VSSKILSPFLMLPAALAVLVLSGCGKSPAPPAAEPEKAAAETAQPAPAEDAAAAELAAKEEELARREADVALKEREAELARREAELAAKESAARKQTAATTTVAKPATTTAAAAPAPAKTAAPPKPIVVPAGTALSAELITPLSTKTARKGDRFQAKLSAPVIVDGQTAVPAGALVEGYVVEKVSGSKEIGAIPSLTLTFDKLVPTPDYSVAISGQLVQAGKSEAGADTAKIAGGAIAGAIIGHQVNKDKGSIIGGVLGAAAGTAAAKNTGAEVELPAGTPVGFVLNSAVEVKP